MSIFCYNNYCDIKLKYGQKKNVQESLRDTVYFYNLTSPSPNTFRLAPQQVLAGFMIRPYFCSADVLSYWVILLSYCNISVGTQVPLQDSDPHNAAPGGRSRQ